MLCSSLSSTLLHWNSVKNRLELVDQLERNQTSLTLRISLHFIFMLVIALQGIFSRNAMPFDRFLLLAVLAHLLVPQVQMQSTKINFAATKELVNGILQFSEKYIKHDALDGSAAIRPVSLKEKLTVMYAYGFLPSVILTPPLFYYGLHWFSPCKASLLGWYFLPECFQNKDFEFSSPMWTLGIALKMFVFIINHWIMAFGYNISVFVVSRLQVLCTQAISEFVDVFYQIVVESTLVDANRLYGSVVVYRKIQLLGNLLNEVQEKYLMTIIILICTVLPAMCAATLVKICWNMKNFVFIAVFVVITMECSIFVVLALGGMADLYRKSSKSLLILQRPQLINRFQVGLNNNQWKYAFLRSCAAIKAKNFPIDFVQQHTPLRCLDFTSVVAINILLLSG